MVDNLLNITNKKFLDHEHFSELRDAIDALQDVSITEEPTIIPHPVIKDVFFLQNNFIE